jgi:hypothetical protein
MASQSEAVGRNANATNNSARINIADEQDEKSSLVNSPRPFTGDSMGNDGKRTPRCSGIMFLSSAWWQEILSLLIASTALVAIVIVLVMYNGKEQPTWKYSINLSALVAILSTLLRVLMVTVVEEGTRTNFFVTFVKWVLPVSNIFVIVVSQLKWLWYRRPRSLQNLADFDQAAHGPVGSLLFIFRIKKLYV